MLFRIRLRWWDIPAIYRKQGKPLLENVFHLFRLTAIRNLKVLHIHCTAPVHTLHRFSPFFIASSIVFIVISLFSPICCSQRVMWEVKLGKVKGRRNKYSKPYERPKVIKRNFVLLCKFFIHFYTQQSILRRATDFFTGLLPQPSWLVNWLQLSVEEQPVLPSTSSAISDGSNSYQEGVSTGGNV